MLVFKPNVLNRIYFSESTLKGFEVPVQPLKMINACARQISHRYLVDDRMWRTKSFNQMMYDNDSHYCITYTLHTRYFYIHGVSDFIFDNFGFYVIYFISQLLHQTEQADIRSLEADILTGTKPSHNLVDSSKIREISALTSLNRRKRKFRQCFSSHLMK